MVTTPPGATTRGDVAPSCALASLSAAVASSATAVGTTRVEITLRNDSLAPCQLGGYPAVALRETAPAPGASSVARLREVHLGASAPAVVLAPRAAAHFVVSLADVPVNGSAACTRAAVLAITPPGSSSPILLDAPVTACGTALGVFALGAASS